MGDWKQRLRFAALACVVGLLFYGPEIAWRLRSSRQLDVVIVDKTVPFRKFREHSFLVWLLHTMKIKSPAGRFLDERFDYVGYEPVEKAGHDLEGVHTERADVVFIADTYGVYVGDYEAPGDVAALERSPRIYGGFTDAEADVIEAFSARGGLLVGEFNSFASPTEEGPRLKLESTFGAKWTHWVGRYWPEMQDENEVPKWVGRVHQRVFGRPLDVKGGAFVFVRDDADMVVLEAGKHLTPEIITIERTVEAPDLTDLPPSSSYGYWLDIVERADADVVYEHVLSLTPEGAANLAMHHVPARFPALLRRRGRSTYYFAGDFVDTAVGLGDPERAGLLSWRKAVLGGRATADEKFLWGWYAPVVGKLLDARARSK